MKTKKIIALILAITMLVSAMPVVSVADSVSTEQNTVSNSETDHELGGSYAVIGMTEAEPQNAADGKYAVFAITEADTGYDNAAIAANFAIDIAPGDTVSFDYKVLNTANYCSISIRGYDKPDKWFDVKSDNESIDWRIDGDAPSLAPVQDSVKVEALGYDWYRVSWTVGPALLPETVSGSDLSGTRRQAASRRTAISFSLSTT